MHHSIEDGKDLVVCLQALLKLEILVPERMGEEVETDVLRASLKKSAGDPSVNTYPREERAFWGGGREEDASRKGERGRANMIGTSAQSSRNVINNPISGGCAQERIYRSERGKYQRKTRIGPV